MFFFVWLGTQILDLMAILGTTEAQTKLFWILILMVYCAAASTLPVWLMLQPRDYLNSYLLYGMLALARGILAYRPTLQMPAFEGFTALNFSGVETSLFPSSVTTPAALLGIPRARGLRHHGQATRQGTGRPARRLCRDAAEGVLGVIAMISVAYLSREQIIAAGGAKDATTLFAQGLATFGTRLGVGETIGTAFVSLSVSAFLMTSLDTSTRLARFTMQELFAPHAGADAAPASVRPHPIAAFFANPYVATLLSVLVALAYVRRVRPHLVCSAPRTSSRRSRCSSLALAHPPPGEAARRDHPDGDHVRSAARRSSLAGRELRKGGNIPL